MKSTWEALTFNIWRSSQTWVQCYRVWLAFQTQAGRVWATTACKSTVKEEVVYTMQSRRQQQEDFYTIRQILRPFVFLQAADREALGQKLNRFKVNLRRIAVAVRTCQWELLFSFIILRAPKPRLFEWVFCFLRMCISEFAYSTQISFYSQFVRTRPPLLFGNKESKSPQINMMLL